LLVFNQLLQLSQLSLQGLHGTVCDTDRKHNQQFINLLMVLFLFIKTSKYNKSKFISRKITKYKPPTVLT
jgi:hypothetical protein